MDIWRQRVDEYTKKAALIKISSEDLDTLYPETSADTKASEWHSNGVALVVVTDGAAEVSAWTNQGEVVRITPPPIEIIDTVGAGDSFQAALLTRLSEYGEGDLSVAVKSLHAKNLKELLNFATAAARITCSKRGADLSRREEISIAGS